MTSIIAIYRRFPTKESCIDHLYSAGYLRAPLPRIERLKEAIEWQDGKYGFYEYNDAFGHFPQVATDEAARAYLKLQGGD